MVESWTRGLSSLKENSQLCDECEIREQRIVLRPRTGLNGGERGQEQGRQAKKQKEEVEDRPRTNLNGGELVQSTFLVLTFAFALAFMATFVLPLILAFLSPFRGKILTFLGCNGEKRSILGQGGIIPFGAFGWAFALAHGDLRRRLTFHRSQLKAGIYCARRGGWGGRSRCGRFFFPDGCMALCLHSPGGRPSVSTN